MALEANIVYLEEELKNNRERLELMTKYLKENPSLSVYKRAIRGHTYYYKKYWKEGKSVSEFLLKVKWRFPTAMIFLKALLITR